MVVLPDDVLLLFSSNTDIDTFLTLRLLNHKISALINAHIHGLTQAVARATFPGQTRILLPQHTPRDLNGKNCLRWLKGLRLRQLAAIMLEGDDQHPIAAEDPLGDHLRAVATDGWKVIARFASIAHEVSLLPPGEVPVREPAQTHGHSGGSQQSAEADRYRELEICARRLEYVAGLSCEAFFGYRLVRRWLFQILEKEPSKKDYGDQPRTENNRGRSYEERKMMKQELLSGIETFRQQDEPNSDVWVFSYLAKNGPGVVWDVFGAYATGDRSTLKTDIESTWALSSRTKRESQLHGVNVMDYQIQDIRRQQRRIRQQRVKQRKSQTTLLQGVCTAEQIFHQREDLTAQGQRPPSFVFRRIPIKHILSEGPGISTSSSKSEAHERTLLAEPSTEPTHYCPQEEQRVCKPEPSFYQHLNSDELLPLVLKQYARLYADWKEAWRKERNGIDKSVLGMQEMALQYLDVE